MRVPSAAACNESVKLAKRYGHKGSFGFVNGLLRNVANNHEKISASCQSESIKYSFPDWMITIWKKQLGKDFAYQMMDSLNKRPEICIRLNTLLATNQDLEKSLIEEKVHFEKARYIEDAYYIKATSIEKMSAFKNGLFYVQDESSMICVRVLDPYPDEEILDICAAPGGKTSYIAALMNNKGKIVAGELHQHRIKLLQSNFERLNVNIAQSVLMDATVFVAEFENKFDKILCDVPCSGLGIIRKKPEIKWRRKMEDVLSISDIQYKILENASKYLKPGGTLVYSTCTLLKEENENVIERLLKEYPQNYQPVPIAGCLPEGIVCKRKDDHTCEDNNFQNVASIESVGVSKINIFSPSNGYHVTLYPNIYDIDGFFISKIKKIM
jgi:16S rRNA (cytosine967-C5)-methyltransferase